MFDKKKPFGIDKVHPFLLSIGALEIVKPLTHIINLSLCHGKFPDSLEMAYIVLTLKQGSHLSCNNHRPFSVLLALTKIFKNLCITN